MIDGKKCAECGYEFHIDSLNTCVLSDMDYCENCGAENLVPAENEDGNIVYLSKQAIQDYLNNKESYVVDLMCAGLTEEIMEEVIQAFELV